MPTPCGKGRCPARADVYDWNTTEYRKGCRRTQCTSAHTLAEQRRKAKKAEAAAAAATTPTTAEPGAEDRPARELPDLVDLVRADLAKLDSDHPLATSLSAIALSLAHEVQFLTQLPARSSSPAAKQLVETLERLLPTKGGVADELEEFLKDLANDDDEVTAD